MEIRCRNEMLDLAEPDIADPKPTLIVLVHGLTELETIFDYPERPDQNYGTDLASHLNATPLRLRYNTGRPISVNGEAFDNLLTALLANWPVPVKRLILIGHSMGGLVMRSACCYGERHGEQRRASWLGTLQSCVYIGTPHDGSWLARAADKAADTLGKAPRDYLRAIADFLNVRSPGIHDLNDGEIHPDGNDLNQPPLVPRVRHYAIAGLLAAHSGHPVNQLFGDALVQENSAKGANRGWTLAGMAVFPSINHIRLTHHPAVYRQLQEWLV
jgi:pimeloyl-ACP methyl ester carboxylesterase